ncbi:MAG: YoaP domain-containing protein [Spirochaetes bacterium]|nr:YoaP domain-containing protein [Spirochaetota bacterium]
MKSLVNQKNTSDVQNIDLTPENIADYGVCGYKDIKKHIEITRKIEWFTEYYKKGLRTKIIFSQKSGYQGMLEYIPGKFAHRPVDADGYMFIHCIFVGFKNEYKGKGYASSLIDECIKDAGKEDMHGVAVVVRKGPFMADKDIFLKKGFVSVDNAPPDFELLALKFNKLTVSPRFKEMSLDKYQNGLTIIRSAQCPYSVKNVDAILKTAAKLKIKSHLIDIKDSGIAQQTPCAFGTFCIIYNGEVISYHPISNTRFENIIKNYKVK